MEPSKTPKRRPAVGGTPASPAPASSASPASAPRAKVRLQVGTKPEAEPKASASTAVADSDVDGVTPADWTNRRASAQATRAANARQESGRRRFVDPTTCERDYSAAEIEFMQAMADYKQRSGRMFPTWSEVLEVLKALGYEKPDTLAASLDVDAAQTA